MQIISVEVDWTRSRLITYEKTQREREINGLFIFYLFVVVADVWFSTFKIFDSLNLEEIYLLWLRSIDHLYEFTVKRKCSFDFNLDSIESFHHFEYVNTQASKYFYGVDAITPSILIANTLAHSTHFEEILTEYLRTQNTCTDSTKLSKVISIASANNLLLSSVKNTWFSKRMKYAHKFQFNQYFDQFSTKVE